MGLNQPLAVYFRHGSTGMVPAILSLIAFSTLVVWRFVFAGRHRRPLVRAIAPRQKRHSNLLAEGLHILELGSAAAIADRPLENSADERARLDRKDPAKRYLQRIAALTGATRMDDAYVLDVGNMQFHVRHRYVKRLRDTPDPDCALDETCFYPVHKGMPKAEEIATALLLLTNNPGLFDKWAALRGAFRADGQAFRPMQ
jgi:hypothetical protein